jgi:1,4-alpha-glucan branching enzyme
MEMNNRKHSKQVFQVVAPDARNVVLVGDLTRFPMRRDPRGIWTTNVTLAPGPHHYRFIVDGKWQDDPACGSHMLNPFGSEDMMREAA